MQTMQLESSHVRKCFTMSTKLIFPLNLYAATLAKAINGLKNPRWQPYGPDPKTHIFFTGFHGLITGFLWVKYGFSKDGVFPKF